MKNSQNNQRGLSWPIVLIVILVLIVGAAVVYTMSQQPSAEDDGTDTEQGSLGQEDTHNDQTMMHDDENLMSDDEAMMHDGDMPNEDTSVTSETNQDVLVLSGQVLAGSSAPLIDFNLADYEKAKASNKLVVLYFYANWCPICKEETANSLYPAFNDLSRDDVVGFRINYNDSDTDDNEVDLAREFGVAYQHTKVFLSNGERVLKSPESWNKQRYFDEINKIVN